MQRTLARLHSNVALALAQGTTQQCLDHLGVLDQYVHVWLDGTKPLDQEFEQHARRVHHDLANLVQRRVLADYIAKQGLDPAELD